MAAETIEFYLTGAGLVIIAACFFLIVFTIRGGWRK